MTRTRILQEDASAASIEDLLAEFSKAELAGFASLLAPFWQPPFSAKGGPPPWWPKELAFVDKLEKLRVKEAEAVLPAMLENVVRNHGELLRSGVPVTCTRVVLQWFVKLRPILSGMVQLALHSFKCS